jgi:hypothetical protein
MASKFQTTGPAHLYYKTFSGPIQYFGTAESAPTITEVPEYVPVMNDIGGNSKPSDLQFDGSEMFVSCVVNRYDEDVLSVMQSRPQHLGPRPVTQSLNDLGRLVNQENSNSQLLVQFPRFAAFAGMPQGYRFFSAVLAGPDEMVVGTRVRSIKCIWRCTRILTVVNGVPTFAVYDHLLQNLPNPT